MEQKDDGDGNEAIYDDLRRMELISDLGLEFVEMIQTFDAEQVSLLLMRLQLTRQAASSTFVRHISTHATVMNYAGLLPAKLGSIKGVPDFLSAWIERRRNIRTYGTPVVNVHIATYARDADTQREINHLMESGYRMASRFELLCFIDGNPLLLGHNDELITLKTRWKGRGSKRHAVKTAHCISRSPKGALVYKTHDFESMLKQRAKNEQPPLFHFVLMDKKNADDSGTDQQPPSGS